MSNFVTKVLVGFMLDGNIKLKMLILLWSIVSLLFGCISMGKL
jgi:hypothetical protein